MPITRCSVPASASSTGRPPSTRVRWRQRTCWVRKVAYTKIPYFFSDQYDLGMEYSGHAVDWDTVVFRGDREQREFIAFWLAQGRVVAGMNVNVWDVTTRLPRSWRRSASWTSANSRIPTLTSPPWWEPLDGCEVGDPTIRSRPVLDLIGMLSPRRIGRPIRRGGGMTKRSQRRDHRGHAQASRRHATFLVLVLLGLTTVVGPLAGMANPASATPPPLPQTLEAWIYPSSAGQPACDVPAELAALSADPIAVLKPEYLTVNAKGRVVTETVASLPCNGYSAANLARCDPQLIGCT